MASTRVHQRLRVAIAAVVAVAVTVVLSGTAHAEPTVADIEKQIDKAWNEAEPLIEKYNATHEQYVKNKAKQDALLKQIAPLQLQVDLAQVKVGAIAAAAYRGGRVDPMSSLLAANSPEDFVDSLSYLDMIARDQSNDVESVRLAKEQYEVQKQPIDTLVAQLQQQDTELAAQKVDIEKRLAELQKLRKQAYGSSTGGIGKYRQWTCPSEYLPTKGYKAAAFACRQAGKPYVWAASGPNYYDCSGLTMTAWRQVGVYLPHHAYSQRHSMPYVSRANLQIGDLVFYYSDIHHVAIYVGNGKVMTAPQTGDVVRMAYMDNGVVNSFGRPG